MVSLIFKTISATEFWKMRQSEKKRGKVKQEKQRKFTLSKSLAAAGVTQKVDLSFWERNPPPPPHQDSPGLRVGLDVEPQVYLYI